MSTTYPIHNPARPAEVVGQAPISDRDQLDAAVAAARSALRDWAAMPVAERVAAVSAAATAASAQAQADDLATLYTREHGKVRRESVFEFETAPAIAALIGAQAPTALAPESIEPDAAYPRLERDPFGVAAIILPFNWPVSLAMTKLSSALVAGNTAVVKPPPSCPLAVSQFGAALAAGLPPGVVNLLSGPAPEWGHWLVTHPGVDVVSLTGGMTTGRAVMAAAAQRLTPVLLELGGNDAAIVAPDLPVTDALAAAIADAAYPTSGQVCMAVKRLYAPRGRVAELVEAVLARCDQEVVGDGLHPDVTLGPMHSAHGRDRIRGLLADAEARGATVRSAGRLHPAADPDGYFVLPTVVTDVPADARVVTEEQFGPVLPILGYDGLEDAVASANADEFGLTASVWTADDAVAEQVAAALVAGTVSINCHGMAAQDPRLPFGGVGHTGIGRELGADGIRAFTQTRSFVRRPPPG